MDETFYKLVKLFRVICGGAGTFVSPDINWEGIRQDRKQVFAMSWWQFVERTDEIRGA